jgi:hypothetical protein
MHRCAASFRLIFACLAKSGLDLGTSIALTCSMLLEGTIVLFVESTLHVSK